MRGIKNGFYKVNIFLITLKKAKKNVLNINNLIFNHFLAIIYVALKSLDLSFNNLKTSPPLGDLRKVENIFLQHNKLIEFPDINGCVELRNLHLSNNQIKVRTYSSERICKLTNSQT